MAPILRQQPCQVPFLGHTGRCQTVPSPPSSFLIFAEMTGRRKRGVKVSTLCLMGNAVFVLRSNNSLPKPKIGAASKIQSWGCPWEENRCTAPKLVIIFYFALGLSWVRKKIDFASRWELGQMWSYVYVLLLSGGIPSWAKGTSQKAVGPISYRKVLRGFTSIWLPAAGCQWSL